MRDHRSNTLLIEIVIVILFFALAQAVILQVFAKAQQINRNAVLTNHALMRAEDTAETLSASESAVEALLSLGFTTDGETYGLIDEEGYRISATVNGLTQPEGVLTTVELTAFRGDTKLFTLPAVQYREVNTP